MNAKLIFSLSWLAAVALTASPVNAGPRRGGGGHGHGHGHMSMQSRGGATFSRGGNRSGHNWSGRNWSGQNWSGGNQFIFTGGFGVPYYGYGSYPYGYYNQPAYGYGYYGNQGYGNRVRLLRQPSLRLRQCNQVRLLPTRLPLRQRQPRLPLRQRQPRLPLQQRQPRVSLRQPTAGAKSANT